MEKQIINGVEWRTVILTDGNDQPVPVQVSELGEVEYQQKRKVYRGLGSQVPNGYRYINVGGGRGGRSYSVHRIVAHAFLDNTLPIRKPAIADGNDIREVDHINGVHGDNQLLNLRIVADRKANCNTPQSRTRYVWANGRFGKHGWKAIQAVESGKVIAEFSGNNVYQQILNWLKKDRGIVSTLNSVKSGIIGYFNRVGVVSAFGLQWRRLKDEEYKHHKYHDYQLAYHRMWRQRQREKQNA